MSQLFYLPFKPVFNSRGLPLGAAKVFFFATGTNTPLAVYSDAALTIPTLDPVSADALGQLPAIYMPTDAVYRVRITKEDGTPLGDDIDPYIPGTLDGLAGPPGPTGEVSFAFLKGTLGSRSANVLDIADWSGNGVHDNASGYQTLVNQAAAAGVAVEAPAGNALLGSTIVLPDGHIFEGKYGAGFNADPAKSSTFLLAHNGKGFTRSGSGGAGIGIRNQATRRLQPAPVTGVAYVPLDADYDYYFADISDLRMTGITTTNATRGIYFNGGRNHITNWLGQCFKVGLHVDWSYDTCRITDAHLWPCWNQSKEVRDYMQANLHSFELMRMDNPFFSRIFSIWHAEAFRIGRFAGDGVSKPAGTVSKLKLTVADLDIGDLGYHVLPEANGHSAIFSGVSMQGRDEIAASPLIQIDGPATDIVGDVRLSNPGANGVRLTATATGSEIALLTRVNDWNRAATGFPAIEVVSGGGHYDALPGSRFVNGSGGANTSGNVTVWAP